MYKVISQLDSQRPLEWPFEDDYKGALGKYLELVKRKSELVGLCGGKASVWLMVDDTVLKNYNCSCIAK